VAAQADGDGWLTREQVKENADRSKLGGWRTVERCIKAGLVAGPQRRPGVGRAPTYRYPPSVLAQLDWVGAQFAAAGKEGRRRPSLALLVHRRWWDAGDPDYFEPWRRDRLRHLCREYQGWVEKRKLSPAAVDEKDNDLAAERWGRQRDWRYRSMMRGTDRRRALVPAIAAMYLGHPDDVRWEQDAFDVTRMAGELGSITVGDVLEHGMGFDRVRLAGFADPGPPGELVRDLLGTIPHPDGQLWIMARLTAAEAACLRRGLIAFNAAAWEAGTRVFIGDLRDKPEVAGMAIAWAGAWGWDTERAGPVKTETCLRCGCEGSVPITASQRLGHCRQCGEWLVNTPEPPPAS